MILGILHLPVEVGITLVPHMGMTGDSTRLTHQWVVLGTEQEDFHHRHHKAEEVCP